MLLILYTVIKVLLLFGITIFVHELGHFIAARKLGLVVDVFSIGFGPAIWKKKVGDITYKIGCLPMGGYVALPQMDPGGLEKNGAEKDDEDADGEETRELPPIAPWRKIIVSVAGVTGNIILAYILACIVFWGGKSYAPAETNVVGYITTNSAAYAQGIRVGDHIDAVNGTSVNSWEAFLVETALGGDVSLQVTHVDGAVSTVTVPTEAYLGSRMISGIYPINHCYVLNVVPGSSAEQAGIKAGDRIVELDGEFLYSRDHLIDMVDARRDTMVPAIVERNGERLELQVKPKYDEKLGRALIGIGFNNLDVKPPLVQIKAHAALIFRLLKALMTRKEAKAAAGAVGGPVAILTVFWYAVQSSLLMALSFTCLVNVNLAVLNLLPIPVLDGGHIIFALWEMVFRRPMHRRVVDGLSSVFAVLLIALFLFLAVRDVTRLPFFSRFKGEAQQEEIVGTNTVVAE